jgi:hypothetical protein
VAWLLAALAVLAVLLTARDGSAYDGGPALRTAIDAVGFATCRLAPDAGDQAATRSPGHGSSVLDVDPPPPALALPRAHSGPDGKPGAEDCVSGTDGLVRISGTPGIGFDPEGGPRTAPIRERARRSRRLSPHVARGPPALRA